VVCDLPAYVNTPGAWQLHDYGEMYRNSPYWNAMYLLTAALLLFQLFIVD